MIHGRVSVKFWPVAPWPHEAQVLEFRELQNELEKEMEVVERFVKRE